MIVLENIFDKNTTEFSIKICDIAKNIKKMSFEGLLQLTQNKILKNQH